MTTDKNKVSELLVSDEQIGERTMKYRAALSPRAFGSGHMDDLARTYTLAQLSLRAIYEAELTKLRSERDELVGFTARLLEYWDAGNFSRHSFQNELRELVAKHKPQ